MSGDEIRAYVLLGCLVVAYPVLLGVKAIEKAMGPEIVIFDGCQYKVYEPYSYTSDKSIKPLDKDNESCVSNQKEQHDKEAIQNLPYKELVKELHKRERPYQ
jgi:hypothetical protein